MKTRLPIFTSGLSLFLLSAWIGAAVFFSAVVAPAAFNTLRSFQLPNTNEIAGSIVTRALSVINVSGFAIGLLLWLLTVLRERTKMNGSLLLDTFPLTILVLATAVGQWVIAAKMRGLRVAMVVIDQVPAGDPRHIAFNSLHRYSVLLLMLAMCSAVAVILTGFRPLLGIRKTSP